ncbi:hypothetical protein [Desulfospira joergensenii]|uniref:hypothetical protein n=1 Tax=Desulfospira joergensenii TaxID=53329 RepID=UPI0003B5B6E3|nr:hypothetical protein [Desulfospira joergensenii]
MENEEKIYQRIGEFAVSFQWIENKLREIGWFIIDPERKEWPPTQLRNLSNYDLVNKVHSLFIEALPKCNLDSEIELDFKGSFDACVKSLHELRKNRNRILHSAFIELKAGGEVQAILRSDPKLEVDGETGELVFNQEYLEPGSFDREMRQMAEISIFLNRANLQLIHRYPNGGT